MGIRSVSRYCYCMMTRLRVERIVRNKEALEYCALFGIKGVDVKLGEML